MGGDGYYDDGYYTIQYDTIHIPNTTSNQQQATAVKKEAKQ